MPIHVSKISVAVGRLRMVVERLPTISDGRGSVSDSRAFEPILAGFWDYLGEFSNEFEWILWNWNFTLQYIEYERRGFILGSSTMNSMDAQVNFWIGILLSRGFGGSFQSWRTGCGCPPAKFVQRWSLGAKPSSQNRKHFVARTSKEGPGGFCSLAKIEKNCKTTK